MPNRLNTVRNSAKLGSELLINVTPNEARVALVEHGVLQEVHIERRLKRGLVGNIYKGKVSRVLPGKIGRASGRERV